MFRFLPAGDPKQSHRIRRLLLAAAASAMVLVMFFTAAVAGVVAHRTVVIAGTMTAVLVLAFYAVLRSS